MRHVFEDLEKLTSRLIQLAEMVTSAIQKATQSLCELLPDLAQEVIDADDAVDQEEVHIEEECIRILVIQQPVASDLRRVVTALKINGDLERMADLAADIAEQARELGRIEELEPFPTKLLALTSLVVRMVRDCVGAFARSDLEIARKVCQLDDEVDRTHRAIIAELKTMIRTRPGSVDAGFHLLSAARFLERIAKHATNIAEDVIFMEEGSIIRHQRPEKSSTKV